MITQKELKQLLHYNPETGVFMWLKKPNGRANTLEEAGTNVNGYIQIRIHRVHYYAHRLAWFYMHGVWPKEYIDHINHIRSDNRIINLRDVSKSENERNKSLFSKNTSGVHGVIWYKKINRWQAQMRILGENIYLGVFRDRFEAICARKSAENKYIFHKNHGK